MTQRLQTLLRDRADAVDLAAPDLAAITRDGSRQVRRRGLALVVGSAAVVAVVAAGLTLVARGGDDHGAPAQSHRSVVWAKGSVIHDGDTTLDVGRPISRFVRTSAGYVFTDFDDGVWSVHDGQVTKVGDTFGPLVGDVDGPLAGWVTTAGTKLAYAVVDQETGLVRMTVGEGGSAPIYVPGYYGNGSVIAIDGRTVYWKDVQRFYARTLGRHDWAGPPTRVLRDRQLITVGSGLAVEGDPKQPAKATVVGRLDDPSPVVLRGATGGTASIAPGGRWVALGSFEGQRKPQVFDTRTGRPVGLDVHGWSALPYEWLDADTVAVLAARTKHTDYQALACSAATGRCHVEVADLGELPVRPDGGNGVRFELPIGDYYFPFLHG